MKTKRQLVALVDVTSLYSSRKNIKREQKNKLIAFILREKIKDKRSNIMRENDTSIGFYVYESWKF